MAWAVLVTARAYSMSGQAAKDALIAAGCNVAVSPRPGPVPEPELIGLLQDRDAVIASNDFYTETLFAQCPQLKVVSRCGVGVDRVDLEAAARAGVVVTNTPGAMDDAVADYTFGLMICVARKIADGDALMRSGGWGEFPGNLVWGKTLGLIGLGRIGSAVARRARGFQMRVLAFDPLVAEQCGERHELVEFVGLTRLLAESDFVSLHAPPTPETRRLIDGARFAQMKPSAFFINTARGELVDEPALIEALETRRIAGAAVDVFTDEPLPADHALRGAPRCLLTPHNAFNALESVVDMIAKSAENVLLLMRGEQLPSVCNPGVWASANLRLSRQ